MRCPPVGLMTEVMKKMQEQAGQQEVRALEEPSEGRPADEQVGLAETPDPQSAFVSSDVATEARASSGEAAGPRAPTTSAAPPLSPETVVWNAKDVDPAVIAFHDRCSAICEQYRSVRARLLTMNAAAARQVIAITSSVPQEGKSVTTVNLGLVMAEGGEHNILIADADFRRTSLARMLGIKGAPGLAELVRGEAELSEVLQPTPCPNLKIIPAGVSAGKSYAELLGGPPARAILADFRALFHYTFLDTPPVTTVSDVSMLAPHCDGTIMVIEMRRTPEPTVQQAVRTLQTNNVKVLGCILSRHPDRPSRYYDRYYYNYYRND